MLAQHDTVYRSEFRSMCVYSLACCPAGEYPMPLLLLRNKETVAFAASLRVLIRYLFANSFEPGQLS